MINYKRIISLLICFFFSILFLSAQDEGDTVKVEKKNKIQLMELSKDPMNAVYYTFIFPGTGQYYVESYWKAPLFAGAAGTLYYLTFSNNSKINEQQKLIDKYEALIEDPNQIDENTIALDKAKRKKDLYTDNRDQSIFYLAGIYIIAAVDAYTGAHLFDFSVDDNLAFTILPNRQAGVSLSVTVSF